MEFYTYELIDSRTSNVIYVGKGCSSRMYAHAYSAIKNREMNTKLKNKILSIIKNNGKILYNKITALNEQAAFDKEKELIKKYRDEGINLCNLTDGGEGISGHTFNRTEESKKRISEIMKDRPKTVEHKESLKAAKLNNPNNAKYWKDKTFSEEHKQKLSKRAQNRAPMSDEHRQHISENTYFRKFKNKTNEEIYGKEKAEILRNKNRDGHLGKHVGAEHRFAKVYVINDNGNIYEEKNTKVQLSNKLNISLLKLQKMITKGAVYNNISITTL